MNISGDAAVVALALLEGALVALPRGNALRSLGRLRSPAWAAVLPGAIVVGTVLPLGGHRLALGLVLLAALATPPLALVAVLGVVRGPRIGLVALAIGAGVLITVIGGWGGDVSTTFLTALGALALGCALARLIPAGWVIAGFVCMCAVDVGLMAAGAAQPAAAVITQVASHVHGPMFDQAHIGPVVVDYPDLVLASVLGGFMAGQRGQWYAAALVTVLVAATLFLTPADTLFPATVPAALTLLALRALGLPRRSKVTQLGPQPASP
jgi:hypothetical protein